MHFLRLQDFVIISTLLFIHKTETQKHTQKPLVYNCTNQSEKISKDICKYNISIRKLLTRVSKLCDRYQSISIFNMMKLQHMISRNTMQRTIQSWMRAYM